MKFDGKIRSNNILNKTLSGILAGALVVAFAFVLPADPATADFKKKSEETWADLKGDIFGDRQILDGQGVIEINAPYRAHDAALVPVEIKALRAQDSSSFVKSITLVIDQNPAPVAAVFHLGQENGQRSLSTRVRVNEYSFIRAIAEMNDGRLFMAARFVKASGGCSAPAGKDQDAALASMGKMKLRQFSPRPASQGQSGLVREAQLMIRHPNNSGLQMDQVTGHYIPAHFVQKIEIWNKAKQILAVEGAISLSEDPSVRFHFLGEDNSELKVLVEDSEGNKFSKSWKILPLKEGGS